MCFYYHFRLGCVSRGKYFKWKLHCANRVSFALTSVSISFHDPRPVGGCPILLVGKCHSIRGRIFFSFLSNFFDASSVDDESLSIRPFFSVIRQQFRRFRIVEILSLSFLIFFYFFPDSPTYFRNSCSTEHTIIFYESRRVHSFRPLIL